MFETMKVGVQLTESCNIACKHCGTSSSPKAGMTFTPENLLSLLEQVREVDPKAEIGFTGGEVFYVRELLFYGIEQVRRLGLQYSITTNATWAVDPQERTAVLNSIKDCRKLGLSSDEYHAIYVDKKFAGLALQEALALNIDAVLRYTFKKGESQEAVFRELGLYSEEERKRVHFNGLMAVGRAKRLMYQDVFPEHPLNEPCLAASVVTVRSNADVFACCGESFYIPGDHALHLGNFKKTHLKQLVEQRNDNVVVQAIRTIGARQLAFSAGVIGEGREDEISALSPCGCCRLCLRTEEARKATLEAAQKQETRINSMRALFYGEI